MKTEREAISECLTLRNKLRAARREQGEGWGNCVMNIKEGTCCGERWVLYMTGELLNSTPETNEQRKKNRCYGNTVMTLTNSYWFEIRTIFMKKQHLHSPKLEGLMRST